MPGAPEEEREQTQHEQGRLEVDGEERLRVRLLFKQFLNRKGENRNDTH